MYALQMDYAIPFWTRSPSEWCTFFTKPACPSARPEDDAAADVHRGARHRGKQEHRDADKGKHNLRPLPCGENKIIVVLRLTLYF